MSKRSRRAMSILRHRRLRRNLAGTAARPRLSVFRSGKQIYAQVVDDKTHHTLVAANTLMPSLKPELAGKKPVEQAEAVGKVLAEKATAAGIKQVVFDRGGFKYHGRIKALADGAREGGLEF